MNPRLLSSGELEEIFRKGRTSRLSKTAEASFRAHIAALEADSAARLAAFGNYVDMHGVEHDLGCPEDDTCECPLIVALKAAFRDDSPGATLLSEHARALTAAFTEGTCVAGDKMRERFEQQERDHAKELENGKAERDRLRDGLMEEARWGAVGRAAALALRSFSKSDAELLDVVLQRALVRARNEGLDLAATSEEHAAMTWEKMGDADEAKRCRARASNIRAMKENEQ